MDVVDTYTYTHYPTGTSYKHQTPLLGVESVQFISLQLNHLKSFLCFLRTPCWHFSGRPWCGTGHHAWVATAEAFSSCCSKEWKKDEKKQVEIKKVIERSKSVLVCPIDLSFQPSTFSWCFQFWVPQLKRTFDGGPTRVFSMRIYNI